MDMHEGPMSGLEGQVTGAAVGAVTTGEKLKTLFKEQAGENKKLVGPMAAELVKLVIGVVPVLGGASEVAEAATESGVAMKLVKLLGPKAVEKISALVNKDGGEQLQVPGWVEGITGLAGLLGVEGAPALVPAARLEYLKFKQVQIVAETMGKAVGIIKDSPEVAAVREKVTGFTSLVKEKISAGFTALTKPDVVAAAKVLA